MVISKKDRTPAYHGLVAKRQGQPMSVCPYPKGEAQHPDRRRGEWMAGYATGRFEEENAAIDKDNGKSYIIGEEQ